MVSEKVEAKIKDRLDGNLDDFLIAVENFGLNYAISKFHLHDLPFPSLHDWTQDRLGKPVWSSRGLLPPPQDESPNYADDLLSAVLRRIERLEDQVKQKDEIIAQKDKAIEYYKKHPEANLYRKMHEIMVEGKDA